jgi:hypothetical protein
MHRRPADPEEALHVGLRRWAADHQRVGMDESKVLPLPRREWDRKSFDIGFVCALGIGGPQDAKRWQARSPQVEAGADPVGPDEAIAANISVGGSTVYRTKRRFVEGNLELALSDEPRPGATRKLSGKERALLVAAPAHPGACLAGRWRCWPARWSSSL